MVWKADSPWQEVAGCCRIERCVFGRQALTERNRFEFDNKIRGLAICELFLADL